MSWQCRAYQAKTHFDDIQNVNICWMMDILIKLIEDASKMYMIKKMVTQTVLFVLKIFQTFRLMLSSIFSPHIVLQTIYFI